MATFGNTSLETGGDASIEDYIVCASPYSPANDGVADSISAYLSVTTAAKNAKGALYNTSDWTLITNGVTEQVSTAVTSGYELKTFNFTGTKPNVYAAISYGIAMWMFNGSGAGYCARSGYDANKGQRLALTYNGYPSPLGGSTPSYRYSAYCTYTPAGAEGQPYVSRVQQVSGMQTFNPIHTLKPKLRKLPW